MYNTHDPRVLPPKNGVRPSCVVLPSKGDGLLLDYLIERLPLVARAQWITRMAKGEVKDEFGNVLRPDSVFMPNVRVYYYREVEVEPEVPFEVEVIYRDEHIVVADKPHFLPVVPGGQYLRNTMLVRLQQQLGYTDLSPAHRIDRDTAGLVLFSVKRSERGAYQAMFRERNVLKVYEAVAAWKGGVFPQHCASRLVESGDFIRMHAVEPNSFTHIELLEHNTHWARYQLKPTTGKRHQLRVQMASLGLGLRGDTLYPEVINHTEGDFSQPLQLLAKELAFTDPITGLRHHFISRKKLQNLPLF